MFPPLRFKGSLRPSQRDVVEIVRAQLAAGERRFHIVAPPGSGKTVIGLHIWAELVKRPVVVLSPNTAIQAQWVDKLAHFEPPHDRATLASTDPEAPRWLTSLTYQSVTIPRRGGDDLDAQAIERWQLKLIEKGQAKDPVEAQVWIEDLRRHNRAYFEQRLSAYRREVRDAAALGGAALSTLHASARATLERLLAREVGLIILDECHHLLGHWGRVLADAHELLNGPLVLGLTATPPERDGKPPDDFTRYDGYFGPVDYEVPVPAVVKDGFLAPYQDLVYFVRPTPEELAFIANADEQVKELVAELCGDAPRARPSGRRSVELSAASEPASELPPTNIPAVSKEGTALWPEGRAPDAPSEPLPAWLTRVLAERRLPTGPVKDWLSFERRDPVFADAARKFLLARNLPLPPDVPEPEADEFPPDDTRPTLAVLIRCSTATSAIASARRRSRWTTRGRSAPSRGCGCSACKSPRRARKSACRRRPRNGLRARQGAGAPAHPQGRARRAGRAHPRRGGNGLREDLIGLGGRRASAQRGSWRSHRGVPPTARRPGDRRA